MAKTGIVTGWAEIDAKLKSIDPTTQKKLMRKSLRKGAKLSRDEAAQIAEQETDGEGAYAKSLTVKAMKRSRTRIGVSVIPDRKKYFAEYEKRYGKQPNPAANASEPFYVPAALEFGYMRGDTYVPPVRAQRRGLYDNSGPIKQMVREDMQEVLRETAAK
jgi:hypothetical protein